MVVSYGIGGGNTYTEIFSNRSKGPVIKLKVSDGELDQCFGNDKLAKVLLISR